MLFLLVHPHSLAGVLGNSRGCPVTGIVDLGRLTDGNLLLPHWFKVQPKRLWVKAKLF